MLNVSRGHFSHDFIVNVHFFTCALEESLNIIFETRAEALPKKVYIGVYLLEGSYPEYMSLNRATFVFKVEFPSLCLRTEPNCRGTSTS